MNETQRQVQLARFYRNLRFLVVDDFENFRLSIRQMIRTFGVERIEVAGNGEDAVARCEYEEFDIVLCDYNLGSGKSGQQVLEELRYNKVLKHTTLFVLITAETAKDMVMGALEYLPDCYLTKPITKAVLQQRLDNLVEQREALKPINEALDHNNLDRALALLDEELKRETKYVTWCLRTMASVYFQKEEYKAAYKIYEEVLSKRDIGWARLGMGKVRIAMGDYEQAVEDFTGLLRSNANLIEAYDYLAEAYLKMGKSQAAQQVLKDAVAISPHAIMRQKKLAEVAFQNNDLEGAAEAYRNSVRLGHNSVHESPQNYLNLGRCLSDLSEGDTTDVGKKRAKEAVSALERVAKKFPDNSEVVQSSLLIQSRVHQGQGDDKKSREALSKARQVMGPNTGSPEAAMELARTLYALGEESEAEQILSDLAQNNADNQQLLNQIEELLDEPVSNDKKLRARKLNKDGIAAFEAGNLEEAILVFEDALKHTPKHPALNLNLVQVILKQVGQAPSSAQLLRRCQACLANVKHIPPQHRQYKRYQHLVKKVEELAARTS